MAFQPSVSLIIAVKDARTHLQETLKSIRSQTYQPLEVIVIDGASSDGTQAVINENLDIIRKFISEPDAGISDAFNKGIQCASGDYINFQGAGDILYSPDCIQKLFQHGDESFKLICGKVMRVQEDGVTPIWIAPRKITPFKPTSLLTKLSLPHQGLFTHRSFFDEWGLFDLKIKYAMDYEHLLRAYHDFPKTLIKDVLISKWRAGGVGTNRILEILAEYHEIKLKHNIAHPEILKMINFFNKTKYYLKSKILKVAY